MFSPFISLPLNIFGPGQYLKLKLKLACVEVFKTVSHHLWFPVVLLNVQNVPIIMSEIVGKRNPKPKMLLVSSVNSPNVTGNGMLRNEVEDKIHSLSH